MSTKPIMRGLVAVRAEGQPNIPALVEEVNTAFAEFRRKHSEEVAALRTQCDENTIALKAGRIASNDDESVEVDNGAPTALRTAKQFRAHYAKVAQHRREEPGLDVADTFRAVAGMKPRNPAIMASLSEGSDADGGYSVPVSTMPSILNALTASSALLQAGAGIVPMPFGAKSVTQAIIDTLPTAAWRRELGAIAESAPTFRGVTAAPKSLACIVRVSRELLADSLDIDRAITWAMGKAFALELDRVGLFGTGADPEPKGLANIAGVNAVAMGANGTALADYSPIRAGIKLIAEANAPAPTSAIMSVRSATDFDGLHDTLGQPLNKSPLVASVAFRGTTQVKDDDTVGTSDGCSRIFMGDFTQCYFLLREGFSVQLLREKYAGTGELGFLVHQRADFVTPFPQAFAIVSGVRPSA